MRKTSLLSLVSRLLSLEIANGQNQSDLMCATGLVVGKLGTHLSKNIGRDGYKALLQAALKLTALEFPQAKSASVAPDGSLIWPGPDGESDQLTKPDSRSFQNDVDGAVAFIAHFFELLNILIGEDLTLRIIRTIWPDVTIGYAHDWETVSYEQAEKKSA